MGKNFIVTIDGPAGSGKSTTAKKVADALFFTYLDTGALYRAVAFYAISNGFTKDFQKLIENLKNIHIEIFYKEGKTTVILNGEDVSQKIRTLEVSSLVSPISAIPEVRKYLLSIQREIAKNSNVILDGRDTGTVVFPNADIKIFLVADVNKRAERRLKELKEMGQEATFEEVVANLKERDEKDSTRAIAPLKKADDAIEIDTSNITIEEQVERVIQLVREKMQKG
ncbi:MAG TPA: (d)CMP kinase [Ignavibacteriales bacterium]|nr:(d)CMP kinase [Ignavibacteriales bacterium]HPD66626.1 (d)CMP kinase [Ignavibacteriales bacterium]HRT98084.1 (d)CMP kinase [Ignavibacteriales bacterium]